jgi:predicted class III extradiol MEMO1 family dioxygenase
MMVKEADLKKEQAGVAMEVVQKMADRAEETMMKVVEAEQTTVVGVVAISMKMRLSKVAMVEVELEEEGVQREHLVHLCWGSVTLHLNLLL